LNFLTLKIPKTERLAGDDLLRFKWLRDQREILLRRRENQVAGS